MAYDRRWTFTCNKCGRKQTRRIGRAGIYVTCRFDNCRQVNPGPSMVGGLATAGLPPIRGRKKAISPSAPAVTQLGPGTPTPSPGDVPATPGRAVPPANPTPHTPAGPGSIFDRMRQLGRAAVYGEEAIAK